MAKKLAAAREACSAEKRGKAGINMASKWRRRHRKQQWRCEASNENDIRHQNGAIGIVSMK
jgi:hypothetical protein